MAWKQTEIQTGKLEPMLQCKNVLHQLSFMRTISKTTWRAHQAAIHTNTSGSLQRREEHDNQTKSTGNRFHNNGVTLSDIHQFHLIQHLLL